MRKLLALLGPMPALLIACGVADTARGDAAPSADSMVGRDSSLLVDARSGDATSTDDSGMVAESGLPDAQLPDSARNTDAAADTDARAPLAPPARDLDGDAFADVLIGAPYDGADGHALLYRGAPVGALDSAVDVVLTATSYASLGRSVAFAGDVNGDGLPDIAVSAPNAGGVGADTGKVYLYLGSTGVLDAFWDVELSGLTPGEFFGRSVASAGDVNGDSYSDVAVSSEATEQSYVFLGGVSSFDTTADAVLSGGWWVTGAGDVNGDGYDDVAASLPSWIHGGALPGEVRVYLGGAGIAFDSVADTTLLGEADFDWFGMSVAGAGDVNGDSYSDLLVGANMNSAGGTDTGAAYVYFGGPGVALDPTADAQLLGTGAGDQFGETVAGLGDVNGDGYSDVAVSAFSGGGKPEPMVYIYFGGAGLTLDSVPDGVLVGAVGSNFGWSVAAAGDVDGDGYTDVVVSAPSEGIGGAAYIFLGGAGTAFDSTPDLIILGTAFEGIGYSVAYLERGGHAPSSWSSTRGSA